MLDGVLLLELFALGGSVARRLQPTWPDIYLQLQQLNPNAATWYAKSSSFAVLPGYVELFTSHFFEAPLALALARATGSAQAINDAGLQGLEQLVRNIPHRRVTLLKVLTWARTAAPAQQPQQLFRQHLERLAVDFLDKSREIRALEQSSAHVLAQTPYVLLLALPGISIVTATELAGELGPLLYYANANHITGRAGLCPSAMRRRAVRRRRLARRRKGPLA